MHCPNCGKEIQENAKFCIYCGTKLNVGAAPNPAELETPERTGSANAYRQNRGSAQNRRSREKTGADPTIIVLSVLLCVLAVGTIVFGVHTYKTLKADTTVDLKLLDESLDSLEDDTSDQAANQSAPTVPETVDATTALATVSPTMETTASADVQETETIALDEQAKETVKPSAHMVLDTSVLSGMQRLQITKDMVTESSYLLQTDGTRNYGYLAFDGDPITSWQDGDRSKEGIGETLTVSLGQTQSIGGFYINNGNHRSQEIYNSNSRVKTLQVDLDDVSYVLLLSDSEHDVVVYFDSPIPCETITFTILDTYPGAKYNDTTIADIGVYAN